MDGQQLVNKIIKGSPTVDLLRKRVEIVTKTIVGIFNEENPMYIFEDDFLSSSKNMDCLGIYPEDNPDGLYDVEWLIVAQKERKRDKLVIKWSLEAHPGSIPRGLITPAYSTESGNVYSARYIEILHEGLPVFLEKITKQFPFIIGRLKPILNAADYAEKNGWKF